jgi:hypothetical protein
MLNVVMLSVIMLNVVTPIRLGKKYMAVANTLAYYNTATIRAIKSFIVQAQRRVI